MSVAPTLTEAAKLALELKRLLDVHGSLSMGAKQIIEPVIDRMAALAAQEALPAVGESVASALRRYQFLLGLLIERGVLTDQRYGNGTWSLQGIALVDDSGLRGAGRTPEEALDNAVVACNLDPEAARKFWSNTHAALAPPVQAPASIAPDFRSHSPVKDAERERLRTTAESILATLAGDNPKKVDLAWQCTKGLMTLIDFPATSPEQAQQSVQTDERIREMSRPVPEGWVARTEDGQEFEIDDEGKVLSPPGLVFKRDTRITIGPRERCVITEENGVRTARLTGSRFWLKNDAVELRVCSASFYSKYM